VSDIPKMNRFKHRECAFTRVWIGLERREKQGSCANLELLTQFVNSDCLMVEF
jgi:hypothetical protein